MNETRKIIGNIVKVAISNVVILFAGLLTNFCLPNIMPVKEFGIYKEFSLYFSYVGLLHFGFVDGIYIKYGGKKIENIDANEFKVFTTFFYLFQILMILIAGFICIFIRKDLVFFILLLSFLAVSTNITTYYQYISQATERFDELSLRNFIKSIFQIVSILVLLLMVKENILKYISAKIYIIIIFIISLILMIWYEKTYKSFSLLKIKKIFKYKDNIKNIFICGFPILIAGSVSNLILISDRQFAVILVNNDEYAFYAFAYSVAALFTTLISAISTVLFPAIKKIDSDYAHNYSKSLTIVLIAVFFFGIFYKPIEELIKIFVPIYSNSLLYLLLLMPAILINMVISAVNTNYYKALGMNKEYLKQSIIVLIIAVVTNGMFYSIFHSLNGLCIASVLTFYLWYFFSTNYLGKYFRIRTIQYILYVFLMIIVFYLCYFFADGFLSSIAYCLGWAFISFFSFKNTY